MCNELVPEYKPYCDPITYSVVELSDQREEINKYEERECIFCKRKEPDVTFKKIAHIIPAALGNRIWFNCNECDQCNEDQFSPQEDDLSNFFMIDRILLGARKRRGFPKYKPNKHGESFMQRREVEGDVLINIDEYEEKFEVNINEVTKQMVLKINNPLPYSYVNICKCITHMGWSFLSNEKREEFAHIPAWLLGEFDFFPLYLDEVFVPGTGYSNVMLEIREAIEPENEYPLMFRFTFASKILTFYLPKNTNVREKSESDLIYIQAADNIEMKLNRLKIVTDKRIFPEHKTYTMGFKTSEIK